MFRFMPRRERFFEFFRESAENALLAAKTLNEMYNNYNNPKESWKMIMDLEHEGDRITHRTMRMLNQTFLTPIDREDIHALTAALDDVIDAIEAAAARVVLYKIDKIAPEAKKLSEIIVTSVEQMVKAVMHMPRLEDSEDYCIEINRLENEADSVYREAIAALFDGQHAPLDVIKWQDIFEILEEATDRCEDVANIVENIGVKNA